jgi:hypothetical protein
MEPWVSPTKRLAKQAVEMLPVSKDAVDGPGLVTMLTIVYALTGELEQALQDLSILVKTPSGMTYGDLKLNPAWDSLRGDPRFDKLLAQLAPHQ